MTSAAEMFTDMDARKDRPAYVRFERRAEHDSEATQRDGVMRSKNVDYAIITPTGTKDVIHEKVIEWFPKLRQQVERGRFKAEWLRMYEDRYKLWQSGQDLPEQGTPIRGWPVITVAQQENLIAVNVRTVEDLAQMSADTQQRFGLGGLELRRKAETWLRTASERGPLTLEMERLQRENDAQKTTIEQLQRNQQELAAQVSSLQRAGVIPMQANAQAIPSAPIHAPQPQPDISSADLGLIENAAEARI